MEWILFLISLEAGLMTDSFVQNNNTQFYETPIYFQVEPEIVLFDLLHAKGTINVITYKEKDTFLFAPVSLISEFDIFLNFKQFTVGYKHLCEHPVSPAGVSDLPFQELDVAYNKFYVRFSTQF